jgi:hypothetical protein
MMLTMGKLWAVILGLLLFGVDHPPMRSFAQAQTSSQEGERKSSDLELVGTITKIYPVAAARSWRRWAIVAHVDSVSLGEFSGTTFSFTVHSPARAGLRVNQTYIIKAKKTNGGYVVDELRLEAVPPSPERLFLPTSTYNTNFVGLTRS